MKDMKLGEHFITLCILPCGANGARLAETCYSVLRSLKARHVQPYGASVWPNEVMTPEYGRFCMIYWMLYKAAGGSTV